MSFTEIQHRLIIKCLLSKLLRILGSFKRITETNVGFGESILKIEFTSLTVLIDINCGFIGF